MGRYHPTIHRQSIEARPLAQFCTPAAPTSPFARGRRRRLTAPAPPCAACRILAKRRVLAGRGRYDSSRASSICRCGVCRPAPAPTSKQAFRLPKAVLKLGPGLQATGPDP